MASSAVSPHVSEPKLASREYNLYKVDDIQVQYSCVHLA
jgi:hypothetical protein